MSESEMECRAIRQLLPGYAEDALRPAERARCDAHLAACPGCRVVLDGLRSLPSALSVWQPPATDLPGGAQVAARILARARPAPVRFVWRWSAAAAAALALVAAWWGFQGRVVQRGIGKPGAVVAQGPGAARVRAGVEPRRHEGHRGHEAAIRRDRELRVLEARGGQSSWSLHVGVRTAPAHSPTLLAYARNPRRDRTTRGMRSRQALRPVPVEARAAPPGDRHMVEVSGQPVAVVLRIDDDFDGGRRISITPQHEAVRVDEEPAAGGGGG